MDKDGGNPFAAGEQALGYIYQPRLALLRLLQLPEDIGVLIEKDDDLDFVDGGGVKTLASLKHKASGDKLTDLSVDFWKSIRIWLERYNRDGGVQSHLRFFIFTTSEVSETSFLTDFQFDEDTDLDKTLDSTENALAKTTSKSISPIKEEFDKLSKESKKDFLSRIVIFDQSPRIENIPNLIVNNYMRTVRREFRQPVYERLEGWWNNQLVKLLTGERTNEIFGHELSDKLSSITDQYKTDNLPIDFHGKVPEGGASPESDQRLFVDQLRAIGVKPDRIQNAIYDYYRAFEQRSSWARENVLLEGEVEEYEDRLIEEWSRYRDVIFEDLESESAETTMIKAGRELYKWAELNTDHLRIRERVSAPYVVRGSFHILANNNPLPKVYWHPIFLERLNEVMEAAEK
jgi:hypothetical protein